MPEQHIVKSREGVDSIAFERGLAPDTVWNDPANAMLRAERPNRNVLADGDVLVIPNKRKKTVRKSTGQRHTFHRRGVPARVRIQLLDKDEPMRHMPYVLSAPGHKDRRGMTDSDGVLIEWAPPDVTTATLRVGDNGPELTLNFGELEPIESDKGRQQRLNNLGFSCGRSDGVLDDATAEAVRSFQRRMLLAVSGDFDEATVEALFMQHDQRAHLEQ